MINVTLRDRNPVRVSLRESGLYGMAGPVELGQWHDVRILYNGLFVFEGSDAPQRLAEYVSGEHEDGTGDGWRVCNSKDTTIYSDILFFNV